MSKIKEEVRNVNEKLHELTSEELEQISGGNSGQPYNDTDLPQKPGEVKIDPKDFLTPFG